jgi:DNA-binding CsgD family transcriptional regulator
VVGEGARRDFSSDLGATVRGWPLVGRDQESSYVGQAIERVDGRGVILAGVAGVGKTRLAQAARDSASTVGWASEWISATVSARSVPLAALAHLLPPPDEENQLDQLAYFGRVRRVLSTKASGSRLLLIVDDAHALDDASAALIHHLAISSTATLLLTVRSGEACPDAITSLWKDGLVDRLDVQALARDEVHQLVRATLGDGFDERIVESLWQACTGNPLYLRELLLDAATTTALRRDDGGWIWQGPIAAGPRLDDLIESRLAALPAEQRRVLDMLAIGEPLPSVALGVADSSEVLGDLERLGLVVLSVDGNRVDVRVGHPLHADVLRRHLTVADRRRIARGLAAWLNGTGLRRAGDVLRVATWLLDSGDISNPELLTRAASLAAAGYDHDTAERLARAALAAGPSFAAGLQLGEAMCRQARFADALAVLEGLDGSAPDDAGVVRLAFTRSQALYAGLGRLDEAKAVLENALDRISDSVSGGLLRGQLVAMLALSGDTTGARTVGLALLNSPDERTQLRSITGAGAAFSVAGQTDIVLQATDIALDAALRLHEELPAAASWVMSTRMFALFLAGRLDETEQLVNLVATVGGPRAGPDQPGGAYLELVRGRVALARGRARTAIHHLGVGAVGLVRGENAGLEAWRCALLAEAAALVGDTATAGRAAHDSEASFVPTIRRYEGDSRRALAWVKALNGQPSAAVADLLDVAAGAAADGQLVVEANSRHDLVRLGRRDQTPRLAALAEAVDGLLVVAYRDHAAALDASDIARLEAASHQFEELGLLLLAAEAAQAEAAHAETEGLRPRATTANRRVARLLAACEGARSPALEAHGVLRALSLREREVATLASRGHTNREIADLLTVSIRTVETHLYQAFAKLGVIDRRQLSERLQGDQP